MPESFDNHPGLENLNPAHAFAGETLIARFGDEEPRAYRLNENGVATEWRDTVE